MLATASPLLRSRLAVIALASLGLACLAGVLGPSLALLAGTALALTLGNPLLAQTRFAANAILKAAVVGLGFGLPLDVVLSTARDSLALTVTTIALALMAGWWLARWLKVETVLGQLLATGTAICGGSAIVAVAPVLRARQETVAVAVAVVFLLNGVGLLIFPTLGHWLELSQREFGLWAALAIHDTSSVVGAAAHYGDEALAVATTAKLARAIWIVPLVFLFGIAHRARDQHRSFPLFISLFLLASLTRTLLPAMAELAPTLTAAARSLFALSLLGIGAGLTRDTLRQLSVRPLLLAVLLWLLLASSSLLAIRLLMSN